MDWWLFFDILGYQNFLDKNDPEIAAEKISEFIKSLKGFQTESFLGLFSEEKREEVKPIIENIIYLVISDAILITLEANKNNQDDYRQGLKVFLLYCARLFKELFVFGLPVRGAIEYGEYILIEKQTFAGRPIVNAYRSALNLDLSACRICDSVGDLSYLTKWENLVFFNYETPLTTKEEKPFILLVPVIRDNKDDQITLSKIEDFKQFIIKSFSAHNKIINKSVQEKILNTEFFFRYCKTFF